MALPQSLAKLISPALNGNIGAWKSIVDLISPLALRYAQERLPSHICPEDAIQESLLIVYNNLHKLRNKYVFLPWFKAILHSQCIKLAARHPYEISLDQLDTQGLLPPSKNQNPEDVYWVMELRKTIDFAIKSLPWHLREVAFLFYLQELSIDEIAQLSQLPQGTIKKRLFTAKRLLMGNLTELHDEEVLRVGYMPISDHLLSMCADHLHSGRKPIFDSRRYLSWSSLAKDLQSGVLDAAFIMVPLALYLLQTGTKLIYVMNAHHDGSSLAVSTANKQAQCIGVPSNYSTHRILLNQIAYNYPEFFKLPTVVVNPSSVISSMRTNKIDAFFCGEPWISKCVRQGLARVVTHSHDILPNHMCCILVVRQEYAQHRDQLIVKYIRALRLARDKVYKDLTMGAKIQSHYTNVEIDSALHVLERRTINFDNLTPDQARIEALAKLAQKTNILDSSCALTGFAQPDFFGTAY